MRQINELIWHCTATRPGWEKTVKDPVKEIDSWHRARGFSGFGYHKLILEDGSVRNGRPESQVGAHVANRNAHTLGYSYAGGLDANDKTKGRDTRTPAQKRTMERLTREAIARYGLIKVSGHGDYANKACPCFNARDEYAHLIPSRFGLLEPMEIEDEHDSKYDEPIVDERKQSLVQRWWKKLTGGALAGIFGGVALTDWQVVLVLVVGTIITVLVIGGALLALAHWYWGKERVAAKLAELIG